MTVVDKSTFQGMFSSIYLLNGLYSEYLLFVYLYIAIIPCSLVNDCSYIQHNFHFVNHLYEMNKI